MMIASSKLKPSHDHEADQHVAAQGQLALVGGGAVGDDLALFDLVADA